MLTALFMLAAATGSATTSPDQDKSAEPLTLQQRFDAAMDHAKKLECREAIPLFEQLETNATFKPGTFARSMVDVRKGRCQIWIGDIDVGAAAVTKGLPGLRKAGAEFDVEVAESFVALGDAAISRWNYAGAKAQYLQAAAIPNGVDPVLLNVKLARSTAFDGTPEALTYADKALRLAEANEATSKGVLATVYDAHARILLNQGRSAEAYSELRRALKLSGGLTLKVSLADLVMRNDLAVAAELSGDKGGARQYLAFTGQGRIPDGAFDSALAMEPPVCGTETGLRPDDMAIVEFSIGEDGHVIHATTSYTRGSAHVAREFAKAVSNWVWDPESIKNIPTFMLYSTHVELRCTTQAQQVPGVTTPLQQRFTDWAAKLLGLQNLPPPGEQGSQRALVDQLKGLAQDEKAQADPLRKVAALGLTLVFEPSSPLEHENIFEKIRAAAGNVALPVEAKNWLEISQTLNHVVFAQIKTMPKAEMQDLVALADTPAIADDALAADTIRLIAATTNLRRSRSNQWSDLLSVVAKDDRLAEYHPLRQLANLSLANEAAKDDNFEQAQRYFEATGLSEEQCALIGAKPNLRSSRLGPGDFPNAAVQYGFEGWVRLEFDIASDGKANGIRPLIAYPPFVFSEAAARGFEGSRYEASFRPSGGNACSANRQGVAFRMN